VIRQHQHSSSTNSKAAWDSSQRSLLLTAATSNFPFSEPPLKSLTGIFAVNARSVALLVQELARRLPGDDGRVVAFTSDALADNVPYGVSKGHLTASSRLPHRS
jgi:NAD(P)-dependent dehydrogenase (short-subunit alcohol dehydrogenase family)